LRSVLLTAQVSVCLVLLIAAGLLGRGLHFAQTIDPGFQMKDITVASFDLKREGYNDARAAVFNRQFAERLSSQPGVDRVGFANPVPLSANRHGSIVVMEGRPGISRSATRMFRQLFRHAGAFPGPRADLRRARDAGRFVRDDPQ
jgi:hypothetical protein